MNFGGMNSGGMNWQAFGDWGTSNLRLYRREAGRITGRADGPGIGKLAGPPMDALRAALARLGPESAPTAITLCGMAGSRTGIVEAPYALCPATAAEWAEAAVTSALDGIALRVAAGLACEDASGRPDVMRGEEAQIFGAMALLPERAEGQAVYLLPGTHSKWAEVVDGRITGFRTFLSGELFDLLSSHSTLLTPGEAGKQGQEDAGFAAGLERALPGDGLAASLFATRSLQLRHGQTRRFAQGFLSGLVIGDEIATMRRLSNLPPRITLIGAAPLCARYGRALALAGVGVDRLDGEECVMRGMELV